MQLEGECNKRKELFKESEKIKVSFLDEQFRSRGRELFDFHMLPYHDTQ